MLFEAMRLLSASLDLIARELLLFAAFWFLLGAIDDLFVDLLWLVFFSGKNRSAGGDLLPAWSAGKPAPTFAVFVPAWQEANVIGDMIRHCLDRWPFAGYRIFIGTYANDPATGIAARLAAPGDPRVHIHVHDKAGPTSKADCLNALWRAMMSQENANGQRFDAVILHDAEDVVHPDAMAIFTLCLPQAALVQLPVLPLVDPKSRWIAGHYADEFAETHGKDLPVRSWLGAGLPSAGVGCAFGREWLDMLAMEHFGARHGGPFAADSFTEDYETGLRIHMLGGRGVFVRARDAHDGWVATRAYFPSSLSTSTRQKGRWVMGIGLAGWDRLGWSGNLRAHWMRFRDRRALLASLVLLCGYSGGILWLITRLFALGQLYSPPPLSPGLMLLVKINLFFLLWRVALRIWFTAAHYGPIEALLAAPRLVISNIVAIKAAKRAMGSYIKSLRGVVVPWDKTDHQIPAFTGNTRP